MADLSKLILLTSVNTFKAENNVQTGSFTISGSATGMSTSGLIVKTYTINLPVEADYYDIMFNGPIILAYTYPNFSVSTSRWAAPGRAGYRVLMNAPGYTNYNLAFEFFTQISGSTLTVTAVSQNQFTASSATLNSTTINYRIIPYSATTQ